MTNTQTDINLSTIKTKSGKTIKDFMIPEFLFTNDKELIKLIMESEAMDDGEKQYWFNLTKVMNDQQKEKLYDILRRERQRLNEIRGITPQVDPIEAKKRAEEQARLRAQKQAEIEEKEKQEAEKEQQEQEKLLENVDW